MAVNFLEGNVALQGYPLKYDTIDEAWTNYATCHWIDCPQKGKSVHFLGHDSSSSYCHIVVVRGFQDNRRMELNKQPINFKKLLRRASQSAKIRSTRSWYSSPSTNLCNFSLNLRDLRDEWRPRERFHVEKAVEGFPVKGWFKVIWM